MSMQHWTKEGYGFRLFTGGNEDAVYQFMVDHDSSLPPLEEFRQAMREDGDMFSMWDFLGEPASWILADIINKLEGTTVFKGYAPCGDTDQEEMIGIEPVYPWEANREDLRLRPDTVRLMMEKYAGILGSDDSPDYFEAYYFG